MAASAELPIRALLVRGAIFGTLFGWLVPIPVIVFLPVDITACACDEGRMGAWLGSGLVFLVGSLAAVWFESRVPDRRPAVVGTVGGVLMAMAHLAASAHYVFLRDGHAHNDALLAPKEGLASLSTYMRLPGYSPIALYAPLGLAYGLLET